MSIIEWINGAVVVIGVPTIVKVLIDVGGKLKTLETIDTDIRSVIKPELKDVRERFSNLEGRLSGAFAGASPISLLSKGSELLEKSGLKKYIDDNKEDFIQKCCKNGNPTNQYDIQEMAFSFFDNLAFGDFEPRVKQASFEFGLPIETVRRIGGIYFRDILLDKFNFKPEDLDKPKN